MKKFLISIFIFLILVMPVFSFAKIVPDCDGANCNFDALMALVNNIIRFVLFDMAIPIAAIMFVYAGFILMTAGSEVAAKRTQAKSIFTNAVIGLVLAAAAWLIIRTILSILGYNGDWIGF